MRTRIIIVLLAVFCLSISQPVFSWTTVGTGIEYQKFTTADPNNIFVCRMDRANTSATIETCMPNGKLSGSTQIVRNQAALLDEAISWWGQSWGARNDVICAVNGDFWNTTTLMPTGGQIHSGWYAKRFGEYGGDSGFGWTTNRVPFMGDCVMHRADKQVISYPATAVTQQFQGINVDRGSDQLIIYTPQWDSTTLTDNNGSEVVVQLARPLLIIPLSNYVQGTVKEIRQNEGSTPIPFDCVVLSATGTAATTLLANVSIGSEVRISQEITSLTQDCSTSVSLDWTKTFASVGGNFMFLRNGVIQSTSDPGLTARNPRTAIAYNDSYIYFIVVDGRSAQSVGMSMTELGNWCINNLQAVYGMNQDGGGSSTMVVNGTVMNNPSDGSERAVANGIMLVNILPKSQTTTFTTGQTVKTTATANMRLGPGTNYAILATFNSNTSGTIASHSLNGVLAKGYNWWYVNISGISGWVTESLLTGSTPLSTCHVYSITPSIVKSGKNYKGRAVVVIQDNNGDPVSNATVTGDFTGDITQTSVSDVTDATGTATITSTATTALKTPTFQFCVTNVTHGTLTYDSSANVVTCATY